MHSLYERFNGKRDLRPSLVLISDLILRGRNKKQVVSQSSASNLNRRKANMDRQAVQVTELNPRVEKCSTHDAKEASQLAFAKSHAGSVRKQYPQSHNCLADQFLIGKAKEKREQK